MAGFDNDWLPLLNRIKNDDFVPVLLSRDKRFPVTSLHHYSSQMISLEEESLWLCNF